jgi:hypothetical protein
MLNKVIWLDVWFIISIYARFAVSFSRFGSLRRVFVRILVGGIFGKSVGYVINYLFSEKWIIFVIIREFLKISIWIWHYCKGFQSWPFKVISTVDLFVYLLNVFISIKLLCLQIRRWLKLSYNFIWMRVWFMV